jgi:oligopeptide/dipeptide ABC transporter ATP-binding protein
VPDGFLQAEGLHREFRAGARARVVRAVDGVSFDVPRGETLAVVGESGSGKTTLARLIVGLTVPTSGRVTLDGVELAWSKRGSHRLRKRVQMIFQDPMGSLDPRWRVEDLVAEPLSNFTRLSSRSRLERAREMLANVGLDDVQARKRPAELSGGQRQRVGIARAIVLQPDLVVCDEPVSALDVSIRGQILELLTRLKQDFGLTYIIISHDLGIVRRLADRIGTMYLGRIVELAPTAGFFHKPLHPYSQALLSAGPVADPQAERARERIVLRGEVADASRHPSGCRFHPRCPLAEALCREQEPELRELRPNWFVRCHFAPDATIHRAAAPAGRLEGAA